VLCPGAGGDARRRRGAVGAVDALEGARRDVEDRRIDDAHRLEERAHRLGEPVLGGERIAGLAANLDLNGADVAGRLAGARLHRHRHELADVNLAGAVLGDNEVRPERLGVEHRARPPSQSPLPPVPSIVCSRNLLTRTVCAENERSLVLPSMRSTGHSPARVSQPAGAETGGAGGAGPDVGAGCPPPYRPPTQQMTSFGKPGQKPVCLVAGAVQVDEMTQLPLVPLPLVHTGAEASLFKQHRTELPPDWQHDGGQTRKLKSICNNWENWDRLHRDRWRRPCLRRCTRRCLCTRQRLHCVKKKNGFFFFFFFFFFSLSFFAGFISASFPSAAYSR
jgi:hypothetical protein